MESIYILWWTHYFNLLAERGETVNFFEAFLFFEIYCYCQSQETSSNTIFRWYTITKFSIVKFNCLSEKKVKESIEMKFKTFLVPSLYILEKTSAQQTKRQMCYKKYKSLFLDVAKNGQIFLLKVCHFQYDHRLFL